MKNLLVVVMVMFLLGICSADEPPQRFLFVVDASASMAVSWRGTGGDRFGAVRGALDAVVPEIAGKKKPIDVAVRVFGSRFRPTDERSATDTVLLRPLAPADTGDLSRALDGVSPTGASPLAAAISAAAGDLGRPTPQDLVLLFVDGLDSTGADLREAFAALTLNGEGAEVHAFTFGLEATEQAELGTLAAVHPVSWPAQAVSFLATVLGKKMSLPSQPATVSVSPAVFSSAGSSISRVKIFGSWQSEPQSLDPSRGPGLVTIGLGSATVIATDGEGGLLAEWVRVPTNPERGFAVDTRTFRPVVLALEPMDDGWGLTPAAKLSWQGGNTDGHQLVVSREGTPGAAWIRSETIDADQTDLVIPLPPEEQPITAQIRRPGISGDTVLSEIAFTSPARNLSLDGPDSALPGSVVGVTWRGTSAAGDLVTLVPQDAPEDLLGPFVDAVDGPPADFQLSFDRCRMELRYIDGASFQVIARRAVDVNAPAAQILVDHTVTAAKEFQVHWIGPARSGDVLTLAAPEQSPGDYVDWADPGGGSPITFLAPDDAGTYVVRYTDNEGHVLASDTLEVEPVSATIRIPKRVRVGQRFDLAWTGPNRPEDLLVLVPKDGNISRRIDFVYASVGSPTSLAAPDQPGLYEVRYLASPRREVIATADIKVVE